MAHQIKSISSAIEKAAQVLGSQKALAKTIGVSPQAVWAWIHRNSIPATYCTPIEIAVKGVVTRRDLRPHDFHLIWPELNVCTKQGGASLRKVNHQKRKKVSP